MNQKGIRDKILINSFILYILTCKCMILLRAECMHYAKSNVAGVQEKKKTEQEAFIF